MSDYQVILIREAQEDFERLDHSQQILVAKALKKLAANPLPASEGGYGRPLGNKGATDLTGLLKVKLRGAGLRIVYKLERAEGVTRVIVIGAREDNAVYRETQKRRERYGF